MLIFEYFPKLQSPNIMVFFTVPPGLGLPFFFPKKFNFSFHPTFLFWPIFAPQTWRKTVTLHIVVACHPLHCHNFPNPPNLLKFDSDAKKWIVYCLNGINSIVLYTIRWIWFLRSVKQINKIELIWWQIMKSVGKKKWICIKSQGIKAESWIKSQWICLKWSRSVRKIELIWNVSKDVKSRDG